MLQAKETVIMMRMLITTTITTVVLDLRRDGLTSEHGNKFSLADVRAYSGLKQVSQMCCGVQL
jgi:hypothetical protein